MWDEYRNNIAKNMAYIESSVSKTKLRLIITCIIVTLIMISIDLVEKHQKLPFLTGEQMRVIIPILDKIQKGYIISLLLCITAILTYSFYQLKMSLKQLIKFKIIVKSAWEAWKFLFYSLIIYISIIYFIYNFFTAFYEVLNYIVEANNIFKWGLTDSKVEFITTNYPNILLVVMYLILIIIINILLQFIENIIVNLKSIRQAKWKHYKNSFLFYNIVLFIIFGLLEYKDYIKNKDIMSYKMSFSFICAGYIILVLSLLISEYRVDKEYQNNS